MTDQADQPSGPAPKPRLDVGWLIRATPAAVVIALFVVFAIQNSDSVEVEFLAWTFETRRIFVLVAAAVAGVIIWELLQAIRRRRKRKMS